MLKSHFLPPAFLGPIGGPEIIMILVVLAIVVAIPVIVLVVVAFYNKLGNTPPPVILPPALPPTGGPQARLRELEALKEQGFISQEEYAAKRQKILEEV